MGNFFGLVLASERGSKENAFVPGLRNLGNNCFLNVILQALASCVSFRIFLKSNIEQLGLSLVEKEVDGFPLLVSLAALFDDLCTLQERRVTLSPLEVMSAIQIYLSDFDLTAQQDAAEIFQYLVTCLREEFSASYVPISRSLAVVASPSVRILSFRMDNDTSEPMRWRRLFLGAFDGIFRNCLTCQSCGSEIIMEYELVHTLLLSPISASDASIVDGCSVEDCLKRFFAAERVEIDCSRCWHAGAMKYLSLVDGHEKEREKLGGCNEQDSCECRNMSCLEAFPWSNRFSNTFQQCTVSCYPKILLLHLQRTAYAFGDIVKLQGHISFQLLLNLSRFVNNNVGVQHRVEHIDRPQAELKYQPFISFLNHANSSRYAINLNGTETDKDHTGSTELNKNISKSTAVASDDTCGQFQALNEAGHESSSAAGPMYRLVSVVEHFKTAGGGHYVVYRGVLEEADGGNDDGQCNDRHLRWFRISDSDVSPASEEDVLAAEASLLFYERLT
ncbi:hypothetical protein Droror1_Dr00003408 [Drosera rotundifolia]